MSEIRLNEVEKSVLIKDYQRAGKPPTLNALLDWRNRLIELRHWSDNNAVFKLYSIEIKAVDYLMQKHYSYQMD